MFYCRIGFDKDRVEIIVVLSVHVFIFSMWVVVGSRSARTWLFVLFLSEAGGGLIPPMDIDGLC